jgi:hypothetical protein
MSALRCTKQFNQSCVCVPSNVKGTFMLDFVLSQPLGVLIYGPCPLPLAQTIILPRASSWVHNRLPSGSVADIASMCSPPHTMHCLNLGVNSDARNSNIVQNGMDNECHNCGTSLTILSTPPHLSLTQSASKLNLEMGWALYTHLIRRSCRC